MPHRKRDHTPLPVEPAVLPAVASRARELRERRGLTQDAAALATGGLLRREEIAKIETGKNLATTSRVREGLAKAYRVPVEALGAYLGEDITLDDLVAHPTDNHEWTHHGNIESALGYHRRDRWSGPTLAAGRAFALVMTDDPAPEDWTPLLDRIEKALAGVGLPMRREKKKERSA